MGIQINGNNDNISAVDGDLSITGITTFSQFDVGSNIKLGNAGVITATSFVGSGANLTGIDTDLVSDTSPQLGGDLASNGNDILVAANDRAVFGTDKLRVKHTDSNADIENTTGNIVIKNDSSSTTEQILIQAKGGEQSIKATANAAVELYHNNSKRLQTEVWGTRILAVGYDALLQIEAESNRSAEVRLIADAGAQNADYSRIHKNKDTGKVHIQNLASGSFEDNIVCENNGAVELYYDNSKKLETTNAGGTLTGTWSGVGKLLQIIEARKTDKFATNSSSFVDVPSLTVNITPSSTSSKILVRAVVSTGMGGGGIDGFLRLLKANIQLKTSQCTRMGSSEQNETIVMEKLDSPATTSQLTYKIQGKVSSNELFVNRDGSNDLLGESTIIVMEVAS